MVRNFSLLLSFVALCLIWPLPVKACNQCNMQPVRVEAKTMMIPIQVINVEQAYILNQTPDVFEHPEQTIKYVQPLGRMATIRDKRNSCIIRFTRAEQLNSCFYLNEQTNQAKGNLYIRGTYRPSSKTSYNIIV